MFEYDSHIAGERVSANRTRDSGLYAVSYHQTETSGEEAAVAKRGCMVCFCTVRSGSLERDGNAILEVLA